MVALTSNASPSRKIRLNLSGGALKSDIVTATYTIGTYRLTGGDGAVVATATVWMQIVRVEAPNSLHKRQINISL